ncbi:MAG TPA: hypothetical protein VK866_16895 [Acidimicrobiales bacterium]|nr:hypothetical protein [Acidimicrobiales bacterium]
MSDLDEGVADAAPSDVEQTGGDAPSEEPAASTASEKPKRGFPSPLTILVGIIVGVWLLALVIPSGQYEIDDDGRPVVGSFTEIDSPLDFGERLVDLVLAPINGFYGIQDPDTGLVGPFNSGTLFGSAQVFVFILAIGGFMTVVFRTGALDLGIAHLAHRFRDQGTVLLVALSLLFGVLGSIISWSDESLGFYALLLPLIVSLGYDRLVAVAVITVAPFAGSIGATVNPFRIGIGSDAAGISFGDGLELRVLMFVLVMAVTITYTVRYAKRVRADHSTSIIGMSPADEELEHEGERDDLEPLSSRHKAVIGLVGFTFVLLIFSIVPWGAIFDNALADPITHETVVEPFWFELGWWLPELSALFIVMAIVIGLVARLGEAETSAAFLRGVADFVGPAILVVVARGVSVILTNTKTLDTVLNAMEGIVDGRSNVVFVLLLSVVSMPLAFLIGSGSAGMALVMPVLAPLGDFAGVDRALIVTTYNSIGGWLLLVLPTNALLIAGLGLAKVGFDVYIRFIAPLMAMLLGVVLAVLLVGVAL